MAFSILNTPRELGRRLLRRAIAQRNAPSSSSGTRRSPRIATAKSPKGKVGPAPAPGSCSPQCPQALPWVHTGCGEKEGSPCCPRGAVATAGPSMGPCSCSWSLNLLSSLCPFQASRQSRRDKQS